MNISSFMKVLEYFLLPHLEKHLEVDQRQFAYGKAMDCLDAYTLLKETVAHYSMEQTDVHCAMVDPSKAYDRIIIISLCNKLYVTNLPEHMVYCIEFRGKNTCVCTSYEGCLSD